MTRHRIEPVDPETCAEPARTLLRATVAPVSALEGATEAEAGSTGGGALSILRTIAHHPHLLEPFLGFAATLATRGVLARTHSELLALRAAWNCGSAFEWGHHVVYARAAGLSEEAIARAAGDAEDPAWTDTERLLLRAADELHRDHDWSDATWHALRACFDDAQLVEIPFVVGQYTMLSMVARATGVPLEKGLPPLPAG